MNIEEQKVEDVGRGGWVLSVSLMPALDADLVVAYTAEHAGRKPYYYWMLDQDIEKTVFSGDFDTVEAALDNMERALVGGVNALREHVAKGKTK